MCFVMFLFFKQETAYEMRISDWSSDVCSSDLELIDYPERGPVPPELEALGIRAYRQLSLPPYRVIYLPDNTFITVLIVADSRRDFRTLLEERMLRRER